MGAFWRSELVPELSQGDIVKVTPISALVWPLVPLKHETIRGGRSAWVEQRQGSPAEGERCHTLSNSVTAFGVILSHSCDLDKPRRSSSVLIAPVSATAALAPTLAQRIMAREVRASVPLVGTPEVGDSYADLRRITFLSRDCVNSLKRLASMTDEAQRLLHAHLLGFFARLTL